MLQSSSRVRARGREVMRQSMEDRGSTGSAVSYMGLSMFVWYIGISWYIDVYRISPKWIKLTILIGGMMINPYLAFVTLHIPALLLSVIDLKGL